MEEGFVKTIVLFTPTDVIFDTVLLLPCSSVEVSFGVDEVFLSIIILETCAEITINPFVVERLFFGGVTRPDLEQSTDCLSRCLDNISIGNMTC